MKSITSTQNEQLKHLAKLLTSSKSRRQHRQVVLEGVHLFDAVLNAQIVPKQVFVPESHLLKQEVSRLLMSVPQQNIYVLADKALAKISELNEGVEVMSLVDMPSASALPCSGSCVVLERVQDPGNIGTILRSAAAAGIHDVLLDSYCADVWSPKVLRSAMGAHFLLRLHTQVDLLQWKLQYQSPLWATALSSDKQHNLYQMDLKQDIAWLFGNEGSGVSETMLDLADAAVLIPMIGATESLNVAMAASICLFEQMRQKHFEFK